MKHAPIEYFSFFVSLIALVGIVIGPRLKWYWYFFTILANLVVLILSGWIIYRG